MRIGAIALRDRGRSGSGLRELLLPRDPHAGRAVILEIRGAEGGEEANLFAGDLYEMYGAYAGAKACGSRRCRTMPAISAASTRSPSSCGRRRLARLKFEGGPHRVQRVPATESQGRIHTSSATVLVLPEADELEVAIDERDLEIDVYGRGAPAARASTPPTRRCASPTYRPVSSWPCRTSAASCRTGRGRCRCCRPSARGRRAGTDVERSAERRSQVGGGGRGEKIRTYNFKENRVTDHRIGFTMYRLRDVLAGDLDDVVDALAADERARHSPLYETITSTAAMTQWQSRAWRR